MLMQQPMIFKFKILFGYLPKNTQIFIKVLDHIAQVLLLMC